MNSMAKLLIITQKVDEDDDLLGFFVDWIREFSKHFDKIFVLALAKGKYSLPENVFIYSLGKEIGRSKLFQLAKFYKLLLELVPQSDGIFAHMSPVFAVAGWPIAFIKKKKIILWYLHRSLTLKLKIANLLSYKVVTAAKESLTLKSNKIIEVGHGINIDKFKTEREWSGSKFRILSVGRISRIKDYETLLRAAKKLKDHGADFTVKIVGQPIMNPDFSYLESLKILKNNLNLGNSVEFIGFIPHSEIVRYYKETDFVVGLTPQGGIDKTILEGMASGALVLTSNRACEKYFGHYANKLIFKHSDPASLAEKIISLYRLAKYDKKNISEFVVKSVSEHHDLKNLITKISTLYLN